MTVGQRIKAARQKAGLTQKELGEKLGISFQGVAQWENDLRKPKYETLQRIASALEVSVNELADLSPFFKENVDPPSEPTMAYLEREAATQGMTVTEYLLSNPETEELGRRFAARERRLSKALGFTALTPKERINAALDRLNEDGQEKAAESVEIIAGNPKYQKEPPQD